MEVAVVKVLRSGIRFVLVPVSLNLPPDAFWKLFRVSKLDNPGILGIIKEQGITPLSAKSVIEEFLENGNELKGYRYELINFYFAFNTMTISSLHKKFTKNVISEAIIKIKRPLLLGTSIFKEDCSKIEEIVSIPDIDLIDLWKSSNYPLIELFLKHGRLRDKIFV